MISDAVDRLAAGALAGWRRLPGRLADRLPRTSRRPRGRILAVKWGLNPNSSSLGVDVTFFLFGATALALTTPLLAALIRWKKPATEVAGAESVADLSELSSSDPELAAGERDRDPTPSG